MMTTAAPDPLSLKPLGKTGPCGEPCEHPCDDPCAEKPQSQPSAWKALLKQSLVNTLDLAFDDVYQEPKKILMVGGCRQRDLAQHLALLLPAAEIVLVDPDEAETQRAQEEICCRFKFITSPLESLPFENETFDLTVAHNFLAYPEQWDRAISDLGRVTRHNLLLSVHRPLLYKLASGLPGFAASMQALGGVVPERLPKQQDVVKRLGLFSSIKTKLAPFPWMFYMTQIKPRWEEKTVLGTPELQIPGN